MKLEKERAARTKEQQESMLVGASRSGGPAHIEGETPIYLVSYVPTTLLNSKQAHIHKGAIAEPKISAYNAVGMTSS